MEEELAKLISDTKKYNLYFINAVYETILNNLDIEFVRLIISNECDSDKVAYYDRKNNSIIFRIVNIDKYYKKSKYHVLSKYCYPLIIVNVMLHEFEHVKQNIQLMNKNNLERIMLSKKINYCEHLCDSIKSSNGINKIKLIRQMHLVKKLYNFSPDERLAYINSYETSSSIADLLKDYKLCYAFKNVAFNEYIYPYNKLINNKINSPIKYYFNKLGINIDDEIDSYSNILKPLDKFKYGLEISEDDLDYFEDCVKSNELKLKIR